MVSRRNYAAITAVMVIIFFLFQFLNMAKDHWNDYSENQYAVDVNELSGADNVYVASDSDELDQQSTGLIPWEKKKCVVCIGSNESNTMGEMIGNWALYMKRKISYYESISAYENAISKKTQDTPQFVLVDPDFINWDDTKQIRSLQTCVENGISVIFGKLPDASIIGSHKLLRRLLGIDEIVQESVTGNGIHLYSGFLLGGEVIYKAYNEEEEKNQDMKLTFPWYHLTSGTKIYMKGMLEDPTVNIQEYPPLIWRKNFTTASVFAVIGDYMTDATGLGMLTAMLSEMQSYTIYPVVNAQNFIAANYPAAANENSSILRQMYSQTMRGFLRDVVWPAFSSINIKTSFSLSSMMTIQFDYTDTAKPNSEDIQYYMEAVNEEEGEMGYSAYNVSNTSISEMISEDADFWNKTLPDYQFASLYYGDYSQKAVQGILDNSFMQRVRTVIGNVDTTSDVVGYVNNQVTRQNTLIDGYEHTFRQDLRIRSVETALGYTSILADVSKAAYPQSDEDGWEKLSEKLMANTITYWKPFSAFSGTTVSQCDSRIRRFLSLNYEEVANESNNKILIHASEGDETAWFVLKTNGEVISDVAGGTYEKIEDNVWLIGMEESSILITLKPSNTLFYYE
jgi:hypothetical protein